MIKLFIHQLTGREQVQNHRQLNNTLSALLMIIQLN